MSSIGHTVAFWQSMTVKSKTVKTVLATGVFDIIHPGHLAFLAEAKRVAGPNARLVVVVTSDATVLRRKRRPPLLPERQRLKIVSSLKLVDQAVLGHRQLDFLWILKRFHPDIVAFGYDQNEVRKALQSVIREKRLPIRVVKIRRFGRRGFNSSTGLKEKVVADLSRTH